MRIEFKLPEIQKIEQQEVLSEKLQKITEQQVQTELNQDFEERLLIDGIRLKPRLEEGKDLLVYKNNDLKFWLCVDKRSSDSVVFGFNRAWINGEEIIFKKTEKSFFINDLVDFEKMKSEPLEQVAQLYYTKKQEEVASFNKQGFLRVRGPAGSGKTTVALRRAYLLAKEYYYDGDFNKKILVTTYNSKLARNIESQLNTLLHFKELQYTQDLVEKIKSMITIQHVDGIIKSMSPNELDISHTKYLSQLSDVSLKVLLKKSYFSDFGLLFIKTEDTEIRDELEGLYDCNWKVAKNNSYFPSDKEFCKELWKEISDIKEGQKNNKKRDSDLKILIEECKNEKNDLPVFIQAMPNGLIENLFENLLIQPEVNRERFINREFFQLHNFHNQITKSDLEHIYDLFELFKVKCDKKKLSTYSMRALDMAENLMSDKVYDHIIFDEAQDLAPAKLMFTLNMLKSRREDESRLDGVTIFMDSSQSLYNPFFHFEDILPAQIVLERKAGKIKTSITDRVLDSVFRNPPCIIIAAENLKKKMHRKSVKGKIHERFEAEGNISLRKSSNVNPNNWTFLTTANNKNGMSFWSFKGQEANNVFFNDFNLTKAVNDDVSYIVNYYGNVHNIRFKDMRDFFDFVFKKSLRTSTEKSRKEVREEFKLRFKDHFKNNDDYKSAERSVLLYLLLVDRVLCHLYVAMTRTKGHFALHLNENTRERYVEDFEYLFNEIKEAA